jgi:hypothetical protein
LIRILKREVLDEHDHVALGWFLVQLDLALFPTEIRTSLAGDMSAILLKGVVLHADLGLEFGFPNTRKLGGADGQRARGPIEFEAFGFKLRGASGPIVLWVFCFLSIAAAFQLLWRNVA